MTGRHVRPVIAVVALIGSIGLLTGCAKSVAGSPVENVADATDLRVQAEAKAATKVCDALTTGHAGISSALDRDAPSEELADAIQKSSDGVQDALTPKVPSDLRPVMQEYITAASDMAEAFRTFEDDGEVVIDAYFDTLDKAEEACAARDR